MLLRRITEHVKAQNWTAVALDFVIVVVGVFIGIQVSNWNAARADSVREAIYIAALQEDFRAVISELENDIAEYDEIAASMALLIEQSRKAEPDVSLAALNDAAAQLRNMVGTRIVSDTYSNLTGSGDLAIIKSQAVKNGLASFFAHADVVALVSATHELQLTNIFQPYIIANLDYVSMLPDDRGLTPNEGFDPNQVLTALPTVEFRNVAAAKWDAVTDLRNLLNTALIEARSVEALLSEKANG